MEQTAEIRLGETTVSPEKASLVAQLPTSSSLFQEGSKIARNPSSLAFGDVVQRMGLPFLNGGTDRIKMMLPTIEAQPNTAKVRLACLALVHELVSGTSLPARNLAEKAIDIILTDYSLREGIKTTVSLAEQTHTPDTARNIDLTYMRTYGGSALERRFTDGRISKAHAVAIASVFESGEFSPSALEKTQMLNFFVNTPDAATIKLSGSALAPEQIRQIILEMQLRTRILNSILLASFPKGRDTQHIPLAQFATTMNIVIKEFRDCRSFSGLKKYAEEIVHGEAMPEKVSRLTDVVGLVRNHPEIKGVSFDLYDTLIQWTSNQNERRGRMDEIAAHHLQQEYGINITQDRFQKASALAWQKRWDDYQAHGKEVSLDKTLGWIIDDVLNDTGITAGRDLSTKRDSIVHDLEKLWYRVELETAVPMPGAREALQQLKAMGIKIGLTSNASWSEAHMRRVLRSFDLLPYFNTVSYSMEHGSMKHPNVKEFFHHAWSKLHLSPNQILHVGDNPEADVKGAKNAGAKAVLYENPTAFNEIEVNGNYWDPQNQNEYTQKARAFHRKSQNEQALFRIEEMMEKHKVPIQERERLRTMAHEVYQKTRDVVGPAYLSLADLLLQKLARGESDVNLCLARDGLPFAIAQKLLLAREPERYKGVKPSQIRYAYVSRKFIDRTKSDPAFKKQYQGYLAQLGVKDAKRVMLADLCCFSGKTHEGIKELLTGKQVEGYYLDSFRTDIPGNHSFLHETTTDATAHLQSDNMLLLFETLFSGPFESAKEMIEKADRIAPDMNRKSLPPEVLTRGLSKQSILFLNHIAVKGLMDTVESVHRNRLLHIADLSPKEVMDRFYTFIKSRPSDAWIDIWRSIPWQDYDKWLLASANPIEDAMIRGKI